jgi:pyruvate,water dikinase
VDQWTIDKATGAVIGASIARKSRRIVPGASGTVEVHAANGDADQSCLDTAQLAAVAELLVRVEATYGFPQDIEWAWAGGALWLLQSRPVTTLPARWTRDESAERFPNVVTPLTWDFVEAGFHRSLEHSFRLLGFPRFSGKWFGKFGHTIYGNQNAVDIYLRRSPLAVRSLDELRAAIPRVREQYGWVQELPVAWLRDLDYYLVTLGRFLAEPLEGRTPREVWRHVLAVNEHGAQYFLPNIAISIAHGTIYRLLHGLMKLALPAAEATVLFDHLMAWCDTKTGQINKELFELAGLIRGAPRLEERLHATEASTLLAEGVLAEFPECQARFQRFLRDHGHREVDFDAYVPTWGEAPAVVLDHVRLLLKGPMDRPPALQERELKIRAQQAEVRLFAQLPTDLHFFFAELLRLARAYTSLDDLEHYQTTRLTPVLRRGLHALGQGLVARGALAEPMDVFFAHQQQIEDALGADTVDGWQAFRASVEAQKAAYLADQARKPEWILGEASPVPVVGESCAGELRGLAGSPGTAEGPVFIVLTPSDFARFPKGSVLVARTTNPTWTPLFYAAVAVVTESGGPLSHGAVTAREMGIPAVMAVKESLARLHNGQRVRVDGTTGRVQVIAGDGGSGAAAETSARPWRASEPSRKRRRGKAAAGGGSVRS